MNNTPAVPRLVAEGFATSAEAMMQYALNCCKHYSNHTSMTLHSSMPDVNRPSTSVHTTAAAHLEAVDAGLLLLLSQLLPVWLLPAAWLAVRKRLWPAEGMGGTLPVQSARTTSASSLGKMICPPYVTKWHSLAALQQHRVVGFCRASNSVRN